MQDDRFEWDDDKARANFAKHKVSFEVARAVLEDALAIDEFDLSENYYEERTNRTGMVAGRLITVTYTVRGERFRIISARRATKGEQNAYFDRQT